MFKVLFSLMVVLSISAVANAVTITRLTATHTLTNSETTVLAVNSSPNNAYEITLPSSPSDGQEVTIKNLLVSTASIDIVPNSGQYNEFGSYAYSVCNGQSVTFVYDSSTSTWEGLNFW